MAARAGMAELIIDARGMAHAGTADHTFSWGTYWSDEHIQEHLDRYRDTVKRVPIQAIPEYTGGSYIYKEYPLPFDWVERGSATVDTSAGFAIRDGDGAAAPSNTINWDAGIITFDDDQDATIYYLDVRHYNMHRAVADIWETKAGFYESKVDWASDNHRIAASQQAEAARKMAAKFRAMAGPTGSAQMVRGDVMP